MIDYQALYQEHGDFLWGYCYRLTGSAADAEDLVQETFVRALERPPADTAAPWRPWMVRVATNLRRDAWRRQKVRQEAQRYKGPWLPAPIATEGDGARLGAFDGGGDAEGRYEMLESVGFAFLLAVEALSAQQRAVLLLRDVYDYSGRETAAALGLSEANVKTTLHRARRALEDYDRERRAPSHELAERTRSVLERFLACHRTADPKQIEQFLAREVRAITDSNGHFHAARVPVVGRERVALFLSRIAPPPAEPLRVHFRTLNGLPAVLIERPQAPPGLARCWAAAIELDPEERVRTAYAVLAPEKLAAVTWPE